MGKPFSYMGWTGLVVEDVALEGTLFDIERILNRTRLKSRPEMSWACSFGG